MKDKSRRRRLTAVGAAVATALGTLLGLVGATLTAVPAGAVMNPNTSYEFDCTTSLQAGVVAPFLLTTNLNTINAQGPTDSAFPANAKFGVAGAVTGTIIGPVIAGLEQALAPASIGLNLGGVNFGPLDTSSTGSAAYSQTFAPAPASPSRQIQNVTWPTASTTLTAAAGAFNAATDVGLSVAGPSGGGISPQAVITAVAAGGGSATISVATTAASPAPVPPATGVPIGLGKTTSFTDQAVSTGATAFTTSGVNGGKANIGVTQATTFTVTGAAVALTFGGAAGVSNPAAVPPVHACLMTGFTAATPPVAGPLQFGATAPALPAGTPGTTPLVLATGGFLTQPGTTQAITPPAAAFVNLVDTPPTANNLTVNLGVGGTKTVTLPTTDPDATPVTGCSLVGAPPFGGRLGVLISNAPTPCQATLTDSGTTPATVTFQFNATDGVGTSATPGTVTVSIGTPPVTEPLSQLVNAGQLVLSCGPPGPTGPSLTCPQFQFPSITLDGSPHTTTGNGSTLFVADNRGDPTVGWTLQASFVATPIGAGSNTNPSCSGIVAFCNENVGANALKPNGQIAKSNLSIGNIACPVRPGNTNPAATAGAGGSFASTQQVCSATAGQSGGAFDVTKTYTLVIPASVFAGKYWGTVEFLVQ